MTRRTVFWIAIAAIAIFFAGLLSWLFIVDERPTVGVLLPNNVGTAYAGRRAGFLTAMESLPNDVNFVNIDYGASDIAQVLQRAFERGVHYYVGVNTSSEIMGVKNFFEKTNSVLIESQMTNPNVLMSAKYVYSLAPTDDFQAKAIADYIKYKGYRTISVIEGPDDPDYVDFLSSQVEKDLPGYGVKIFEYSELGSIKKKTDAFVLVMSAEEAMPAMRKIEGEFGSVNFIGSDWTFSDLTLMNNLDVSQNMVVVGFVNSSNISSTFGNLLMNAGLQVTSPSVLSHDALLIAYSLAKNRISARNSEKYLDSNTFFGLKGKYIFKGKFVNSPIYFYRVTTMGFKLEWTFGG